MPTTRNTFDEARERREQDGTELKVGAITKFLWKDPEATREQYLSVGEAQFNALMDTMDCASRAAVEELEKDLTYAYRKDLMSPDTKTWLLANDCVVSRDGLAYIELADAWTAIKSGTTKSGNSLKAPCQSLHADGFVPKKWMPFEPNMQWEDYHNPARITQKIRDFAQESKKRLPIKYQQVPSFEFTATIPRSGLSVAGHAWKTPVNGVYLRNDGAFNHAFNLFKNKFYAKDSYDPYIKQLAPDFRFFDWGYEIGIVEENVVPPSQATISLIQQISTLIKQMTDWLNRPAPVTPTTLAQKLYNAAYAMIGKEASPLDAAPDNRACVDSLQEIYKSVTGKYLANHTLSTTDLTYFLKASPLFEKINFIEPGCITVFPTFGTTVGHVGIGGKTHVMSNDSATGLWQANYTHLEWVREANRRGLPLFHFRPREQNGQGVL